MELPSGDARSPLASPFGRRLALSVGAASRREAMSQALRCGNTSRLRWETHWIHRNVLAPQLT
ncbi:MAG: hypothetical protein V7K48_28450 [Nostoc sp.]